MSDHTSEFPKQNTQFVLPLFGTNPTEYIYALVDPNTGKAHYVGISNDPRERLKHHWGSARGIYAKGSTPKRQWLQGLRKAGLKPILWIIQDVSTFDPQGYPGTCEEYWIDRLASEGHPLTNAIIPDKAFFILSGRGSAADYERKQEEFRRQLTITLNSKFDYEGQND